MKTKQTLKEILDSLPVISESELRTSSKKYPAVHQANIIVNYPLTGMEQKTGFVFGTNEDRSALYLSRDALQISSSFSLCKRC